MRYPVSRIAFATALLVTVCGVANASISGPSGTAATGPAGDYPMVLGDPFVVDGVTYTPVDTMNYDSVGYAQAGGGDGVSGAHRTLPLPSYVEVTSLETGRTILVRLTARGPMSGSNVLTLSAGAWSQLGASQGSRLPVRVRRVNPPEAERALLRAGGQAPARMDTPPGLLSALKRKLGIVPVPPVAVATVAPKPAEPPRPEAAPPAKPVAPKAPVTAKTEPAPAKPKTVAAAGKRFNVQVGAYSTRSRADAAAKATGGFVSPAGKLWRVRVGPHKDRGQAEEALAKVRAGGYADASVVTAP